MKHFIRVSFCALVMISLIVGVTVFSNAETVYDKYDFMCPAQDSGYLEIGVASEDLKYQIVNGSRFEYFVRNGEATILNVRTNYTGPNKSIFVFPTHLGGYPVTTIGAPIDSVGEINVFDYIKYPDDEEPKNPIGTAFSDPGLRFVSDIIIPEGYKSIGTGAFMSVDRILYIYLPKSLKYLGYHPYEEDAVIIYKPWPDFIYGIESATDTPYVAYGDRDYKINVTGSPSKIQVVRDNGGTTTIDRRKATVTSNGDTETWIVNMRVEAGTHNIRAKYGTVWADKLTPFIVEYDLPKAYLFDLTYEDGIGKFDVVTDPEVIKIQFALDNGCTLTYSQVYSYIGEDGLRHWEISRKIPEDMTFTLKTKYGYTWTTTNFEVNTIV